MAVYVVKTYWDIEHNEGYEIFGVYAEDNLEKARLDIRSEQHPPLECCGY